MRTGGISMPRPPFIAAEVSAARRRDATFARQAVPLTALRQAVLMVIEGAAHLEVGELNPAYDRLLL
jgi:hypothetical protein